MIRIKVTEYAMQFTGATLGEVPLTQKVLVIENSMIGDALIQKWRDEVENYYNKIANGLILNDSITLASGKSYEATIRAVSTGLQLWI